MRLAFSVGMGLGCSTAPVAGCGTDGDGGLPVYALGGVRPGDVAACRAAGAYGVAVMGPVMSEPTIVAAYLAALQEVSG